jgi:hypothetical protein
LCLGYGKDQVGGWFSNARYAEEGQSPYAAQLNDILENLSSETCPLEFIILLLDTFDSMVPKDNIIQKIWAFVETVFRAEEFTAKPVLTYTVFEAFKNEMNFERLEVLNTIVSNNYYADSYIMAKMLSDRCEFYQKKNIK